MSTTSGPTAVAVATLSAPVWLIPTQWRSDWESTTRASDSAKARWSSTISTSRMAILQDPGRHTSGLGPFFRRGPIHHPKRGRPLVTARFAVGSVDTVRDDERGVADLLGTLGHELRHVAGALAHQLEVLGGSHLAEPLRQRSLGVLALAAGDLERLTDRLADLETLVRGDVRPGRVVTDLAPLVAEVMTEALGPGSQTAPTAGRAPAGGGAAVMVAADPALVRRSLAVIVAEAAAAGHGVTAVVEVGAEPGSVEVTVGPGEVPPGVWPARPVAVGDGIGPWVAAELARLSGAELSVAWPGGRDRQFRFAMTSAPSDARRAEGERLVGDG
ncbi:MAG: hypothetical protein R2761_18630 [Acidimicrobiales bacterium]